MRRPARARLRSLLIIFSVIFILAISLKLVTDHLRLVWNLDLIDKITKKEGLAPEWVLAVIMAESKFDASKVSRTGAIGLMQLMPATAERMATDLGLDLKKLDLFDPETNLKLGCHYLGWLKRRYDDGTAIVFAAYQAGEGAADRWMGDTRPEKFQVEMIPIAETAQYTKTVLGSLFYFRLFWSLASMLS